MAIDKAVDSTLLNASCTYEAGKIRAKLGSAAQIAYDLANGKGFGDAIEAISSGYTPDQFNRGQITGEIELTTGVASNRFSSMNLITGVVFNTAYKNQGAGGNSFADSKAIKRVFCKNKPIYLGGWSFGSCTALEYVINVYTIQGHSLNGCTSLLAVECGSQDYSDSIDASAFVNCGKMATLVLRKTSQITSLGNVSAFNGTPFASGKSGGALYVPSALISSYQSATNWSTILGYSTNSIAAIEGSPYENAHVDGTPIT